MVLAQDAAGIQEIRILNDNALLTVNNNLLDANEANTLITNGSSDIREAYAMAKWQYWNDRVPTFILSGTGDNLNPVVNGDFVFNEDTNDISTTQFDYHSTTSVNLEGGSITANNIRCLSNTPNATALTNGTLNFSNQLDLGLIDLNTLITLNGTAAGAEVIDIDDADFTALVTLTGDIDLNVGGNARDIRQWMTTGNATITTTSTTPIQVTVTPAQDTAFTAGNNVNFNVVQPDRFVTISPGVTEEFLQTNRGFFVAYETSNGNIVSGPEGSRGIVTITNTTTLADVTISRISTDTTEYRVIYQPLSSLTGGQTFREGNVTWVPMTSGDLQVNPNNDTALTQGTATDRSGDIALTITNQGTTNYAIRAVFDRPGTLTQLSNIQAREFGLALRNDASYFQAIYERRLTGGQPIIEFQQPFTTAYNGQEGDTAGAMIQMVYTIAPSDNWPSSQIPMQRAIGYQPGTNTGGFGFFSPDLINISASLPDVVNAVNSSNRIQDIDNKTSYLVTDGSDNTIQGRSPAALRGSKLGGIKPKRDDYNPGANYITNT